MTILRMTEEEWNASRGVTTVQDRLFDLRDYFAGQALSGVFHGSDFDVTDEIVGRRCYQVADAMLKAREGKP